LERGYGHRRAHPQWPARFDAGADDNSRLAPRFHREKCGSDCGVAERANHRARDSRRIAGPWRVLRRSLSKAAFGSRVGTRMSDFREEEKLGKLYDTRLTHRLMKYLRPYRLQVFLA